MNMYTYIIRVDHRRKTGYVTLALTKTVSYDCKQCIYTLTQSLIVVTAHKHTHTRQSHMCRLKYWSQIKTPEGSARARIRAV